MSWLVSGANLRVVTVDGQPPLLKTFKEALGHGAAWQCQRAGEKCRQLVFLIFQTLGIEERAEENNGSLCSELLTSICRELSADYLNQSTQLFLMDTFCISVLSKGKQGSES